MTEWRAAAGGQSCNQCQVCGVSWCRPEEGQTGQESWREGVSGCSGVWRESSVGAGCTGAGCGRVSSGAVRSGGAQSVRSCGGGRSGVKVRNRQDTVHRTRQTTERG